jgi:transcriptional regulator with XRE-family HTH domain
MTNQYEDLERTLGAGVRALRIDRRLTQIELAELANLSVGALKNLESGRGSSTTTLVRVVHALGQDQWLGELAPTVATFNPLDLLSPRGPTPRRGPRRGPRRVRRSAST